MNFARLIESVLLKIGTIATAVDDKEVLLFAYGRQHRMPDIAGIIHSLTGFGYKRFRFAGTIRRILTNRDQKG